MNAPAQLVYTGMAIFASIVKMVKFLIKKKIHVNALQDINGQESPARKLTNVAETEFGTLFSNIVSALKDSKINPNNYKPDAYSIAPYVGHKLNGGSGDIIQQLHNQLDNVVLPKVKTVAAEVEAA